MHALELFETIASRALQDGIVLIRAEADAVARGGGRGLAHPAHGAGPGTRSSAAPRAQGRRGEKQGVMLSTISLQLGSTERCEVCSGR
ncbi:hypothetical protein GNX71_21190 [Variovorax sp. RKNM96]|nr:hypothetical protein GNX71_21190 [Variovorax sp. RKNM96]